MKSIQCDNVRIKKSKICQLNVGKQESQQNVTSKVGTALAKFDSQN